MGGFQPKFNSLAVKAYHSEFGGSKSNSFD